MNAEHNECRRHLDAAVHITHRALAVTLETEAGRRLPGAAALSASLRDTRPEQWSGDEVPIAFGLVEVIDALCLRALDAGIGPEWDRIAADAHRAAETTEALGLVLMDEQPGGGARG